MIEAARDDNGLTRLSEFISAAVDRTVGAPLVHGNGVRLLRDAKENYPAWLEAIKGAQNHIYFESYIIFDDRTGRAFADALMAKARAGVRVRLIYDWLGALGKTRRRFWRELSRAGIEVRCFNPPRSMRPLSFLHRDHRKLLCVDGDIAFVTGLCVGDAWAGDPTRGVEPWRDTGVAIRGPAVAHAETAFARMWSSIGSPLPADECGPARAMGAAGDVSLRVVASEPWDAGLMRLDQMIAASARERLWLADAYFAAIPTYVQGLVGAARDGVDVRLLVPGSSDIAMLRPISTVGYRPLLEAGCRVFEWKGPMMHAKTAVADGLWARVGSSNLNIASWLGNHELDVVIEDARFAAAMEEMYLDDLSNATEIVLSTRRARSREPRSRVSRARAGRATAGALRVGNVVAAAITERRVLASTEARLIGIAGMVLLALALIGVLWPRLITIPFALLCIWLGIALLTKAYALRRQLTKQRLPGNESDRP